MIAVQNYPLSVLFTVFAVFYWGHGLEEYEASPKGLQTREDEFTRFEIVFKIQER